MVGLSRFGAGSAVQSMRMKQQTAEKVANVAIGIAAVGAAYTIVKTPHLRKLAGGLALAALTGTIPAWLSREAQQAWAASGRRAL